MNKPKNPIKDVLEIDMLIRRAVQKSWGIESDLWISRGNEEVPRNAVCEEVKTQISRVVERALRDMEADIQNYNQDEYRPGW